MINYLDLLAGRYVNHLIVHCSATRPSQDMDSADIDRMHRLRGFLMTGYHFIIKRDGTLEQHHTGQRCRPLNKAGAHVGDCGRGWNIKTIGICLIGGVHETRMQGKHPAPENNFTKEQFSTLYNLIRELTGQIKTITETIGHRDLIKRTKAPAKACPCFNVRDFLLSYEGLQDIELTSFNRVSYTGSTLAPRTHTVEEGDTLWDLSKLYGIPIEDLMHLNNLQDSTIKIGRELRLFQQ